MPRNDESYFLTRAAEERRLAAEAQGIEAMRAHSALADHYLRLSRAREPQKTG